MSNLRIAIIIGSTRPGRNGKAVADWILEQASGREATYELVDLADHPLPLLDEAIPPSMHMYQNEHTKKWAETIAQYDGFVFVTPEYNHGVPGAFKNAVDTLGSEWMGKPVGFVGYGSVGGVRAIENWRTVLANFSMYDVRAEVNINLFTDFTDGEFTPQNRNVVTMGAVFDDLEKAGA